MPTLAELARMSDGGDSGAYVGYPQLQRQVARMRQAQAGRTAENLPDPKTYGFVSGLLGTSPDQLGMSVLSPNTAPAKDAAYYGYQLSNLGQMAPAMMPAGKAFLRTAGNAVNDAMVYGTGPLARMTPQPMFAVNPAERGIVREGNPIQSAVVLIGDKIYTGRTHGDALNRAVYEGVVRKEGGKYIYPKGAEIDSDLFMTKDGQIIDRLQASKMLDIGASETAIEKGLMQNNPARSMTVDSYMEQAKSLKKK